jgi:hypothetical protein
MELTLPTPVSHPPSLERCLHTARRTQGAKTPFQGGQGGSPPPWEASEGLGKLHISYKGHQVTTGPTKAERKLEKGRRERKKQRLNNPLEVSLVYQEPLLVAPGRHGLLRQGDESILVHWGERCPLRAMRGGVILTRKMCIRGSVHAGRSYNAGRNACRVKPHGEMLRGEAPLHP